MSNLLDCLVWLQVGGNMDSDLSPQDKKDLDKFIKFFALKVKIEMFVLLPTVRHFCVPSDFIAVIVYEPLLWLQTVQVIVQARLGEKICTRSSSSPTGSDWVRRFGFF